MRRDSNGPRINISHEKVRSSVSTEYIGLVCTEYIELVCVRAFIP